MRISDKTVLVTGAGGFIGSHLVESLVNQGSRVKALIHYNSMNNWGHLEDIATFKQGNIEVIAGDLLDFNFINKITKDVEVVFHLAALISIPYSYNAPLLFYKVNVEGTINVLQACLQNDVEKVIVTSTSEVYGTAQYSPINENHPLQAQSPYSASKISAEKVTQSYVLSFSLPAAIIRPFNTYGPRQSARAIIPTIITQAITNDTLNLGLLTPIRDMNYVEDTIDGFVKLAESEQSIGDVVNVGSGIGVTIEDIVLEVQKQLNKDLTIQHDKNRDRPEKSEVMELICDNKKVMEMLNWKSQYSLSDGIKNTIKYIRENQKLYKNDLYTI